MTEVTVQYETAAPPPIKTVTIVVNEGVAQLIKGLLGALADAGPYNNADDVDDGYRAYQALDDMLPDNGLSGTATFGPIRPKDRW